MKSYIAILAADEEAGGYSVLFPDLPGCVTQGEDLEDAQAMAVEVLSGFLAVARDHGDPIPEPRSLEEIKADRAWAKENELAWKAATAMLVPVRPPLGRPERVNVSLDSNKLQAIDAYAKRRGLTRSAVLEAGAEFLMDSDPAPAGILFRSAGKASAAAPRVRPRGGFATGGATHRGIRKR